MLIKVATDNKNRTLGEVRTIIEKSGGKMVPAGSLKHLFKQIGIVYIATPSDQADELELKAIDAGALDTIFQGELLQVYADPKELMKIKDALKKEGVKIDNANIIFHPLDPVEIDQHTRMDYEKLLQKLDEQDDVQEIYDNL